MNKVQSLTKYILLCLFICTYILSAGQNHLDSGGRIIWNATDNSEYNNDVADIGRDDKINKNLKQSTSSNSSDITIGIKEIAASNDLNPNTFFADKTFLIWGHNNAATNATLKITKDFSTSIAGVSTSVIMTPISRKWKLVVTDSIPTVKLSVPEYLVSQTKGENTEYIMVVADDPAFTSNVTSATMQLVESNLEVDFYFEGTKYITFGSTVITNESSLALSFNGKDSYLDAGDVNNLADKPFTMSAWVKRRTDQNSFDILSKRNRYNGYALRINKDDKLSLVWRNQGDSSSKVLNSSSTIPENEWHHVAATYDIQNNKTSLYIDGHLEAENSNLSPIASTTESHFIIGASHHIKRQQNFNGSIDEVRLWKVALSAEQIRYIMNQEIHKNESLYTDGKILPSAIKKNDIASVPWDNLIAYYTMNRLVFGSIKDESNSSNDASMINYNSIEEQTAPLPYRTIQDGDWDSPDTWVNGNTQVIPGMDSDQDGYGIIEINHNVYLNSSDTALIPLNKNQNRTILGLIVKDGNLHIAGNTETGTGSAITITHYLKLDGTIDLEGESQLIQTSHSDFDMSSKGSLERDQQGTSNTYQYDYWSSPVSLTCNSNYTVSNVISNVGFITSGFNGTAAPVKNADYWIWKYGHNPKSNQSNWQHIRSTGPVTPGEGFTMKGPGTSESFQNYVFSGQPNNGDIKLTITAQSDYLIGNPYPSGIDANTFILDNTGTSDGGHNTNGNIINGAIYFWNHFALNSHQPGEYQGGYAMYTLMGGTEALNNDMKINADNTLTTTLPQRYIPVGQGFFVSSKLDADLIDPTNISGIKEPVVGGNIRFKNGQRTFKKENESNSNESSLDLRKKIRILFSSPDGYHRQLLVGVDENSSDKFDIGYDGLLIEDNKEDAFWVLGNSKLIIQAVNNFNDAQVLPLGTQISKSGLATFKIDTLENIPDNLDIFLHDTELNMFHNLKESNYTINLSPGEILNRFELSFRTNGELPPDETDNDDESNGSNEDEDAPDSDDNINEEHNDDGFFNESEDKKKVPLGENLDAYYSNHTDTIIIENPRAKNIHSVNLFNILGQSIYRFDSLTNDTYTELKTNTLNPGTYILKLQSEAKTIMKKVLIN